MGITEVMYHPQEGVGDPDLDFIEIQNPIPIG